MVFYAVVCCFVCRVVWFVVSFWFCFVGCDALIGLVWGCCLWVGGVFGFVFGLLCVFGFWLVVWSFWWVVGLGGGVYFVGCFGVV